MITGIPRGSAWCIGGELQMFKVVDYRVRYSVLWTREEALSVQCGRLERRP